MQHNTHRHLRPASRLLPTLFAALLWAGGTSPSLAHEIPPYTGDVVYGTFISAPPPMVYTEPHDDLSVKVLGGKVVVRRSFADYSWHPNYNWAPLRFTYDSFAGSVKTITRGRAEYTRHGVGVYQDRYHNTILQTTTGFRWQDKIGNWIVYDASGVIHAYGDRNNVQVSFGHETVPVPVPVPVPSGGPVTITRMTGVYDHFGTQVLWFDYQKLEPTDLTESLVAIRDANGRRVRYDYTTTITNKLLTQVVDANGYQWAIGYTGALPTTFTDPEGRVITRVWFGNGELAQIRYTDGSTTGAGTGADYHYEYDLSKSVHYTQEKTTGGKITETWKNSDGDIIRKDLNGKTLETWAIDPTGRSRVKTDARGLVTTEARDAFDNITRTVYPDGTSTSATYDPQYSNPLTRTDELGVVTKYDYDQKGNLTKLTETLGLPEQRVTEYSYDQYGQRKTETKRGDTATNTPDALTQYDYDDKGNLIQVTDAESNVTRYPTESYDVQGNAKRKIDARGKVWTKTYDNRGKLLSFADPLNHTTTVGYDRAGWPISLADAANNVTHYGYDARRNITTVTDPYGAITKYEYNNDNQYTKVTDAENKVVQTIDYDLDGRISKQVDGNSNAITYIYGDEASGLNNLLVKIVYPTFSQEFKYDPRDRITEVIDVVDANTRLSTKGTYDASGRLRSVTDKENKTTAGTYDALNRLKTITDSGQGVTEAVYDSRDNLFSLKDPKTQSHHFTYDRVNRRLTESRPLGQTIATTYLPTGQINTVTDPKGQVKKFAYDDVGRRVGESHYLTASDLASNNPVRTIVYSFNDLNRPTGYSDGAVSTGITTYDPRQLRKIGESVNYGSFTLSYSYDYYTNGQKKSFTGPDVVMVNYAYDPNNQLATIQLPSGNITVNSYKWDAPSQITLPGGTTRASQYDPLLRLTQIQVKDPGQSELMNYQYGYDKANNIKTKTTEQGNYSYGYDDLYRLTSATNPSPLPTETYTYDPVGNRLTDAKTTQTLSYNANNQLQGFDGIGFDYDANGNTIKKTDANDPTQTRNYVYDTSDRLIEVRDQNNALIASYTYDPLNRRIAKETTGSTSTKTYFFYADEGLVAEASSTGTVTKTYSYQPDSTWGSDPVYLKEGTSTYYFQNDHLGTSQKLVNQNGQVVWSARAEAFGNTTVDPSSTITNNLRFAGQYYDAETGLFYNWNRYYDPKNGRYVTVDPIGIDGGMNLYLYVEANPVNLSDPTGECPQCIAFAVCTAGCALTIAAGNAITGECNNWGDTAVGCAVGCMAGVGLAKVLKWGFKFEPPQKSMGPHINWGPKYPGSEHPMWHLGPKNPDFGSRNFSWSGWLRGGMPWRWRK